MDDSVFGGTVAAPGQRRIARRTRNDDALRTGTIDALAELGWDGLGARSVSERANLSYGAIYTRFEHLDDLVASVWSEQLWPELDGLLVALVDSATHTPDEQRFVDTMAHLARPSANLLAAIEMIQAAMVDPRATIIVRDDIDAGLARLLDPEASGDEVEATVAATCVFVALGLLVLARRSWAKETELEEEFRRYHRALVAPTEPIETPRDRIAEYLYLYVFDVADDRLERVLQATAISVGEVGYHATTIARICRKAGVSSGFVMGRFPSKVALFRRVTTEMWGRGMAAIGAFIAASAIEIGPTLAEALAWREMQNPVIAKMTVLALETGRLAGFDDDFAELIESEEAGSFDQLSGGRGATAFLHSEYALGNGMGVVSFFRPEVRDLPFACVTETLVATAPH